MAGEDSDQTSSPTSRFSKVGKIGLLGAIGIGLGVRGVKNALLGDSPSTLRKTVVYGTMLSSLVWWSCQDDLTSIGKSTYDWYTSKSDQTVEILEDSIRNTKEQYARLREQNDSLQTITYTLSEKLQHPPKPDTVTVTKRDTVYNTEVDTIYKTHLDTVQIEKTDTVYVPDIEVVTVHHTDTVRVEQIDTVYVDNPPEVCWKPLETHQRLSDIAYDYGLETDRLVKLNGLDNPDLLPVGYPIQLPSCPPDVNVSSLPGYTMIRRNTESLDRQIDGLGPTVLEYNMKYGNILTDVPAGFDMMVYTP